MAFTNGFQGDHVSLNYILKTLEAKTYDIPGIITNPNLQVTAGGESVFFYTRSTPTAATGNAGDQVSYTVKGNKRIDVPLTKRISIGAIIPYVNVATVSPDAVADKVIQETISQANIYNRELISAIVSAAEAKTYTNGASAFDAILEGIRNFKIDNKANGLSPTGILASPTFFTALIADSKIHLAITFRDVADQAIRQLNIPGIPVPVIECVDLDGVDFVVVHAEGVAAPVVAKTLEIVSATTVGYPGGTLIAGELPYGFKIVTKEDDLSLDSSTGYLVAKYTEASS
jgi:hypothetical protein